MKLPWQKKQGNNGEEEIEVSLPKETEEKINKAVEAASKYDEIKSSLDSINAHFNDEKKKREEAEAEAARRKAAEKNKEITEQTDAQIEELILTDPKKAIDLATSRQQQVILQLRADGIRREVFENVERFPYYTGDFKAEVDKLIAQQPVTAQNDPTVIENCYFSLLGKKEPELREGKLKSRFAGAGGSLQPGKTKEGDNSGDKLEINDDIRRAAKIYGTTPEEYAKMVQEAGVGYV